MATAFKKILAKHIEQDTTEKESDESSVISDSQSAQSEEVVHEKFTKPVADVADQALEES